MMMPAYLSYCLTGVIKNEYTNASTTSLVNATTYTWDTEILSKLGIDVDLLGKISMPGDCVGSFTEKVQEMVGFDAKVVFCCSHDTASAVAACPLEKDGLYVSSGTWSLFGTELMQPVLTEEVQKANFANEGGIEHRFRFLKNYMGMWLFQNIRRNLNKSMSYDEMMEEAIKSSNYYYIDVNADAFVAPENMIDAIRNYLNMPELPLGTLLNSVYHSLAKSYTDAANEIERLTGITAPAIHIVGGGSQDQYLNRLTAEYTGKKVFAGPVEATAVGNLLAQILAVHPEYTLEKGRDLIRKSFRIEEVK
jgi:rhamnulokinase